MAKTKTSLMSAVTEPIMKVGEYIADHMPAALTPARPAKKRTAKKKPAAPKSAKSSKSAKMTKKKTAKKKKK